MRITQKLVLQVKAHNKATLHQQKWHDFNSLPEVEAINYALQTAKTELDPACNHLRLIVDVAKMYLGNRAAAHLAEIREKIQHFIAFHLAIDPDNGAWCHAIKIMAINVNNLAEKASLMDASKKILTTYVLGKIDMRGLSDQSADDIRAIQQEIINRFARTEG